jgi:hypothetical protein
MGTPLKDVNETNWTGRVWGTGISRGRSRPKATTVERDGASRKESAINWLGVGKTGTYDIE